jgi:hypothetical protein
MPRLASLPFTLRRTDDAFDVHAITSTKETVHGLVHLRGERLNIQWRLFRKTEYVGTQIRTDKEVEDVRSIEVPLEAVAGAHIRRGGWIWPFRPRLVLTAADLRAFEGFAGNQGLRLSHPAELILPVRRADRLTAAEFVAELSLAIAELAAREHSDRAVSTGQPGWRTVDNAEQPQLAGTGGDPHDAIAGERRHERQVGGPRAE